MQASPVFVIAVRVTQKKSKNKKITACLDLIIKFLSLFIKTNNKVHISSKEEHVTEEARRKLGSMTGQATIQHLYKYKWKTNSCVM